MSEDPRLRDKFTIGNVVRWDKANYKVVYYVVVEVNNYNLGLLPLNKAGDKVYPSTRWPYLPGTYKPDSERTVETVEFVADTIHNFYRDRL